MSDERDYEAEARADGWKPEEEWQGDPPPTGFKTAEQFVKDGEQINGILKSKKDRLEQKVEDLGKRVEELLESNKQFGEFTKKAQERERTEKEKLIKELQKVRAQAITDGDGEKVIQTEEDIESLRGSMNEKPSVNLNPIQKQWLDDNPWYETDQVLAAFADGVADRIVAQGYTGQAYFDELTKRTKEAFPQKFENQKKNKPAAVDEGHEAVVDSDKRTFSNLPKEAKEAFKRFERDIPGFTKEQFLEQYDWEQ